MTWSLSQHISLKRLTASAYQRDQSRMAALSQRESDIRAQLHNLDTQSMHPPTHGIDPASRAGAHALWQRWIDRRMSALSTELASILAQKDGMRAELARTFGKDQVMETLLATAKLTHQSKRR